ncbi:MAG: class II fumarate hydratase [Bacteroidales bacterium]|nr:class II fumarate hydratase [Bacteroidales bacterium]
MSQRITTRCVQDVYTKFRTEHDTLGEVQVPENKYWGAQTQRSLENFPIGEEKMPESVIRSYALLKKAAAITNFQLDVLTEKKCDLIVKVCDEILGCELTDQFPLAVWQTGSGTQTNMNLNEVIANRGHVINGGKLTDKEKFLHPNDDVNKSQSSNDTFPTAMHIAAYATFVERTIPAITNLKDTLKKKSEEFKDIVKMGRTHWMDATPLTLGQEFSGYVTQLEHSIHAMENALLHLAGLVLGGTAVGTGINTPLGYDIKVAENIAQLSGHPFFSAENKFEGIAAHDAMIEAHGALKTAAASLIKIGNDIRLMSSGPRSGIGELIIPANEPGSSIMPGKINPTQIEALTMVCTQIIGNDMTIAVAASSGHFELNVYKPVIIYNFLQSANILADSVQSFNDRLAVGIEPNLKVIEQHVNNSLMLVTSLNPHIGYENAAKIAKSAHESGLTLREAAIKSGLVTPEQFDEWVDARKMLGAMGK